MSKVLYQIDTGYACGGIVTEDGICIEACPIYRWMIGKSMDTIRKWNKIKRVEKVG